MKVRPRNNKSQLYISIFRNITRLYFFNNFYVKIIYKLIIDYISNFLFYTILNEIPDF